MPRSLWFKGFCCAGRPLGSFSQADTGWQPIQETIRKSEKRYASVSGDPP